MNNKVTDISTPADRPGEHKKRCALLRNALPTQLCVGIFVILAASAYAAEPAVAPTSPPQKIQTGAVPSGPATVTAINAKAGVVTARLKSNGHMIHYKVKTNATLKRLKIGHVTSVALRGGEFGPVSWACDATTNKCSCIPGDDCDDICLGNPCPVDKKHPDRICTCDGDPGKQLP